MNKMCHNGHPCVTTKFKSNNSMKIVSIFFLLFFMPYFKCSGQIIGTDKYHRAILIDTISEIPVTFLLKQRQLVFDFSNQKGKRNTIKVDWSNYKDLQSVAIKNYDSQCQIKISGLKQSKIKHLWFEDSDVSNFYRKNSITKNLTGLHIWEDRESLEDTISLPKIVEKFKQINTISIGCCNLISIENVDFSKLKNLDTLILEGPLFEVNSLSSLKELAYLGIWNEAKNSDSIRKVIDTLLPNTKKVSWCFPPNQSVILFNGTTKLIQEIVLGDTLLSYNIQNKCFVPNRVLEVIKHEESNYDLCVIHAFENITASTNQHFLNSTNVVATENHPILSSNGTKVPIGSVSVNDSIFFKSADSIEVMQVEYKKLYTETTVVYNLITVEKNYFVNGFLFSDK